MLYKMRYFRDKTACSVSSLPVRSSNIGEKPQRSGKRTALGVGRGRSKHKSGLRLGTINVDQNGVPIETETTGVKHSKAAVRGKARAALQVRFEPQNLTSYAGLILYRHFILPYRYQGATEELFSQSEGECDLLPSRDHGAVGGTSDHGAREGGCGMWTIYRDDEMVKRVLGVKRWPNVSTISGSLGSADEVSVE